MGDGRRGGGGGGGWWGGVGGGAAGAGGGVGGGGDGGRGGGRGGRGAAGVLGWVLPAPAAGAVPCGAAAGGVDVGVGRRWATGDGVVGMVVSGVGTRPRGRRRRLGCWCGWAMATGDE